MAIEVCPTPANVDNVRQMAIDTVKPPEPPQRAGDTRASRAARPADRTADRRATRAREQLIADWLRRLDPSRSEARRFRR
jgi:hypothetical protein